MLAIKVKEHDYASMHKNGLWIGLVIFVVGLSLWFGGRAALNLHHYYSLTSQTVVEVNRWEIVGDGSSHYLLMAHYTSPFGKGSGAVGAIYRNPWAAERAKERFERAPLKVWFNPKKPDKMVMYKNFPIKSVLSACMLLGLTIYFICLGVYVGSRDQKG